MSTENKEETTAEYKTLAELDAEDTVDSVVEEEEETEEDTEDETEEETPEDKKKPKSEKKTEEIPVEDTPEEDEESTEGPEDLEFFKEVDALHGSDLEVEYGDTDPMSPEGIFIREKAVADRAVNEFEHALKSLQPKAYALLVHAMNGGSESDFFEKTKDLTVLPSVEELEVDVAIQKAVIEKNLRRLGNSEKQIKAIIRVAESDDELEEMAKEALEIEEEENTRQLKEIEKTSEEEQALRAQHITEMENFVNETIQFGKLGNIVIPEKDRKGFAKDFKDNLRYENGRFYSVTELDEDNIEATFQKEYFKYKKGDLDGLIERKAKTLNTKRLIKTINTTPRVKSKTSTSGEGLTLGDL